MFFACVVAGGALSNWGLDTGGLPRSLALCLGVLGVGWVPALGLMCTQLPLRLPDGRPLSPCWAVFGHVTAVVIGVATLVTLLQPDPAEDRARGLHSPIAVGWAQPLEPVLLLVSLC